MVYGDSGRYVFVYHDAVGLLWKSPNWCGNINELLIHFNFDDVWDLQQVEQPLAFLINLNYE